MSSLIVNRSGAAVLQVLRPTQKSHHVHGSFRGANSKEVWYAILCACLHCVNWCLFIADLFPILRERAGLSQATPLLIYEVSQ